MQDLSYDFHTPFFIFHGLKFGIQIFTYENVYSFQEESCVIVPSENELRFSASKLAWAGGQEEAEGGGEIDVSVSRAAYVFKIKAYCANKVIRSVKLILKDVPLGVIVNLRETAGKEIPPAGLICRYPEGWRNLYTPLVVLTVQMGGISIFARWMCACGRKFLLSFHTATGWMWS